MIGLAVALAALALASAGVSVFFAARAIRLAKRVENPCSTKG